MIRFLFLLFSFFTFVTSVAQANDFDYSSFRTIPVLHEGRIKPMESFARLSLEKLSGHESFEGRPALHWLAGCIFDPAVAAEEQVFLIRRDSVKTQLGLPEGQDYFSLSELQEPISGTRDKAIALLQSDPEEISADQQAFLDVHDRVESYVQLLRSLSLILPLSLDVPEKYHSGELERAPTYLDLVQAETKIGLELKSIIAKRGTNPDNYSDQEKELAALAFQLSQIRQGGTQNNLFQIMPGAWQSSSSGPDWFTPWALLLRGEGSPASGHYLKLWQDMAEAYRTQNPSLWNTASRAALVFILDQDLTGVSAFRLRAERTYVALKPYSWALGFYGLSIILGLLALNYRPGLRRSALITGFIAAAAHSFGIALRILILQRPPVGTLYESVLFVSLLAAVIALFIAMKRRQALPALAGSFTGLALLFIAPLTESDTESLDVLAAVLNTNFWLGTHVLVITAGYAISILCAVLAHGYMILRFTKGRGAEGLMSLYALIHKVSLAALLFTAVGTILGGIWADQSWGRFWGWDPKENGALLIVLWLVWVQHGRLSGHLRDLPFMASLACLNIIVALAWFGVNLLGAGLHSYGFTSGMAGGLGGFCFLQILIIAGLWRGIRKKESKSHA